MIARIWRGWAEPGSDDDYERHFADEVTRALSGVPGFVQARLLRGTDGDRVLFTSLTFFTDLDAVRAFAGADVGRAVVAGPARAALVAWDERVTHHEVVVVAG